MTASSFVRASARRALALAIPCFLLAMIVSASGAGLFEDGVDARSISLGGAEAGQTSSVIGAIDGNPAALSAFSRPQLEINAGAAFVRGNFSRENGEEAHLRTNTALVPAAGFALAPLRDLPVTFGIGFIPEIAAEAGWRYRDPAGGLGGQASYGQQRNDSRILALRSSVALAVRPVKWLSLGASAGFIYSEDALTAPYIFQSQPVLAGFKTLLDLNADGVSPAFTFGAQIKPSSKLTLGVSYHPRVVLHSDGTASGNASAQLQALGGGFAQVDPHFVYDAEVRTELPQRVAIGVEWQVLERLRLVSGIDWINWAHAFDELHIDLSHGSNPDINGVVGSSSMTDIAPLRWRDQFVYRGGFEYLLGAGFAARAGYTYARSAVPPETMTPLTAAIFEHKISAGLGYQRDRYHVAAAWQWSLPAKQTVQASALRDGEYSQTSVLVSAHSFQLTTGVDF